LITEYIGDW